MVRQTAVAVAGLALALAPVSLAQVSEGFENGWDQAKWPTYANDCNQGGKVTLDSSTAHSGKNSMRVDGAGGYCGHIFFGTKSVPSGDIYVRTYLKASKALTDAHVSFITMPDSAQGNNKHLRIGGQSKILMYNRESDDATLPDLSPQGIAASKPPARGLLGVLRVPRGARRHHRDLAQQQHGRRAHVQARRRQRQRRAVAAQLRQAQAHRHLLRVGVVRGATRTRSGTTTSS
ncbi:hypothetical protein PG990_000355 [Apiospora arundinis]